MPTLVAPASPGKLVNIDLHSLAPKGALEGDHTFTASHAAARAIHRFCKARRTVERRFESAWQAAGHPALLSGSNPEERRRAVRSLRIKSDALHGSCAKMSSAWQGVKAHAGAAAVEGWFKEAGAMSWGNVPAGRWEIEALYEEKKAEARAPDRLICAELRAQDAADAANRIRMLESRLTPPPRGWRRITQGLSRLWKKVKRALRWPFSRGARGAHVAPAPTFEGPALIRAHNAQRAAQAHARQLESLRTQGRADTRKLDTDTAKGLMWDLEASTPVRVEASMLLARASYDKAAALYQGRGLAARARLAADAEAGADADGEALKNAAINIEHAALYIAKALRLDARYEPPAADPLRALFDRVRARHEKLQPGPLGIAPGELFDDAGRVHEDALPDIGVFDDSASIYEDARSNFSV